MYKLTLIFEDLTSLQTEMKSLSLFHLQYYLQLIDHLNMHFNIVCLLQSNILLVSHTPEQIHHSYLLTQ